MNSLPRAFAGSVLLLTFACGPSARSSDSSADEAAIRATVSSWNEYLRTENDSAIGAIFSPDAVLLPPNMPRVSGAEAIRKFWAGIWPLKASLTLSSVSVQVSDDVAIEEGNYAWSMPMSNGSASRESGKYLAVWRKSNGKWQVVQDMWNSDTPPPPSPPAK